MFNTDRISLLLAVGAIVVTLGVGTCSTNARIDDLSDSVNRRFDDLSDSVNLRFDDVNLRFDDVNRRSDDLSDSVNRRFDQVRADIRALRADHVRFDERLRAVEFALGEVDQRLLTIERVVLPPSPSGE